MSEICMRGRIVLDRFRRDEDFSAEEADRILDRLEAEMDECLAEMGRLPS